MCVRTVSINYSPFDHLTVSAETNDADIICFCVRAAIQGKTVYYISGSDVCKREPGCEHSQYIHHRRNGVTHWCSDYLYAQKYSTATARKIVKELYEKGESK